MVFSFKNILPFIIVFISLILLYVIFTIPNTRNVNMPSKNYRRGGAYMQ